MSEKTLVCLGFGYVARALSRRLAGDGWTIKGTTRSPEKAEAMKAEGVAPILWRDGDLAADAVEDASAILVSTPPENDVCPAFAAAGERIAARANDIAWIGYLSTNGVYGDHDGEWVDETSELRPSSPRARARIAAEAAWASLGAEWALPVVIFRLPGIYGPGRSALDTVREGRAKRIFKKGQVFSRMHVDDIAAALEASLKAPRAGDLFNLADDEPAPPQDVIEYACKLMSVEAPPLTPIEDADLSDMARSFYADNKRVSNALMKEKLGVSPRYPNYRAGLDAIFASMNQSSAPTN